MTATTRPARAIDAGCATFLALVLATALLAWLLISELQAPDEATGPREDPRTTEPDSRPAERLTRRERIRLESELERARRDLDDTRATSRLDTQPETRAQWQRALDAARARVEEIEKRLGR